MSVNKLIRLGFRLVATLCALMAVMASINGDYYLSGIYVIATPIWSIASVIIGGSND